jgi:hypothetical protein
MRFVIDYRRLNACEKTGRPYLLQQRNLRGKTKLIQFVFDKMTIRKTYIRKKSTQYLALICSFLK